jgi:hypothetical protein
MMIHWSTLQALCNGLEQCIRSSKLTRHQLTILATPFPVEIDAGVANLSDVAW